MTKPKRVSQTAIAKALGVSRATVSLVLRGGKGSAEGTQAKVLAMAAKMGYRPNALVNSIRSGKSRTVGVLAQPHDSYWREVCYGIHDRLIESEHVPLFLWTNDRSETDKEAYSLSQIYRMLDRWVDGVILWPYFTDVYSKHLHEFQTRNLPIVAIDQTNESAIGDIIGSDEGQAADLLVGHLQSLGHKRCLVITGPQGIGWADERPEMIRAEWGCVAGSEVRILRLPLELNAEQARVDAIAEGLRAFPEATVIVACTDNMARSAYEAARTIDRRIPGDLSVTGYADLDFAGLLSPPLTTIRQDGYAIGRRAAQVELERSVGLLSGPARRYKEPVSLVIRGSTARPDAD